MAAIKAGLRQKPAGGMVMTDSAACFAANRHNKNLSLGKTPR